MGYGKSSSKRVYHGKCLSQERTKVSNKQLNFRLQGTRKRIVKLKVGRNK